MIEYVVLGDAATAVGILLASTPEKSARYYRDALCTLALAVQPHLCAQCACMPRCCSCTVSALALTLSLLMLRLLCLRSCHAQSPCAVAGPCSRHLCVEALDMTGSFQQTEPATEWHLFICPIA